jgi:Hint module
LEVAIGDKVLVSGGKYEEVYSFGHRNVAESAEFLQIYSNDTDQPIEMSPDHMILLGSGRWVAAGTVSVGDLLTKGDGSHVAVTRLRYVTRKGIFAPFTKSGSIVVNDIVASNYITFQQGSEYLVIGGTETPLTFQWLAHTFQSGHRLACRVFGCDDETYTDSGISHWVAMPREAGEMLLMQHPIVVAIVVAVLVLVFSMLSLVEQWLEIGFVTILIAIVLFRLFKITRKVERIYH